VTSSAKSVVWILGSGFSRSLGGPLLGDLISRRTLENMRHWPMKDKHRDMLFKRGEVIFAYYEAGLPNKGANLWADAEQFLQRLQLASEGNLAITTQINALRVDLSRVDMRDEQGAWLAKSDVRQLHAEAVRCVAAACTAFLLGSKEALARWAEEWQPYLRWFIELKAGDTVVTFNYDRVLDIIDTLVNQRTLVSPVRPDFSKRISKGAVAMCQMHGSVAWRLATRGKSKGTGIVTNSREAVAHLDPSKAILGTPGRGKQDLMEGILKPVWDHALAALRAAAAIVFVGYRFPPSDNRAKLELLEAVRKNADAKVHSVLGPGNADVPRLKGMIEWAGKPLRNHEMYAEDFLAVFERSELVR
jgi:hypothetical protein